MTVTGHKPRPQTFTPGQLLHHIIADICLWLRFRVIRLMIWVNVRVIMPPHTGRRHFKQCCDPSARLSVCLSHAHGSNAVHLMARVTRTLTANPTLEVETLVSMAVLDYTSSS